VQLSIPTGPAFDLNRLLDGAMRNVYERRVRSGQMDEATWRYCVEALQSGLKKGGAITEVTDTFLPGGQSPIGAALKWNTLMVAAFKNHAQTTDLVRELTDPKTGLLRTWHEFRMATKPILNNYNVNWLKTEYQTAVNAALTAEQWQDYQAQRRTYPYLTYITMRDERVRDSHRVLHGITRHIDDVFWDEYYPPNGWHCRCSTKQSRGPETVVTDHARDDKSFPPAFRINPGKTGQIVSDELPYFQGLSEVVRGQIMRKVNGLLLADLKADQNWSIEMESFARRFKGIEPHQLGLDAHSGGFIALSHKHMDSLETEMVVCLHLRDQGKAVYLLPEQGVLNALDVFFNGKSFDIKYMSNFTNLNRCIETYYKTQKPLLIYNAKNVPIEDITNALNRSAILHKNYAIPYVEVMQTDGTRIVMHIKKATNR
jgi:SPP1 gp7 family putative phage head morphogenesis protein